MATKMELTKKIAMLESVNDQMYTELCEIDKLMRLVGFENGIETVKLTAQELYKSEHTKTHDEDVA